MNNKALHIVFLSALISAILVSVSCSSFCGENDFLFPWEQEKAVGISAGAYHSCAVLDSGHVKCWGKNDNGQLGNSDTGFTGVPRIVDGLEDVKQVSAGGSHTCAVTGDGAVKCWGMNGLGQLGIGTQYTYYEPPQPVRDISNAVSVSAGYSHSCALLANSHVMCWGNNGNGMLGNGSTKDSTVPVEVPGIDNAVAVSVGRSSSCALLDDGSVFCWGYSENAPAVDGKKQRFSATPFEMLSGATSISLGDWHGCAVLNTGKIKCWGSNQHGQISRDESGGYGEIPPVQRKGIDNAIAVSAGAWHTCALLENGGVRCWGAFTSDDYGFPWIDSSSNVEGVENAVAISSGNHVCALLEDGRVKCWGSNVFGQLGNGKSVNREIPGEVIGINDALSAETGRGRTLAVMNSGIVKTWGDIWVDFAWQDTSLYPSTVASITTATSVVAGDSHTCARLKDWKVKCWGSARQLGDEFAKNRGNPEYVPGLENVLTIAAGSRHTCALSNGSVICWGDPKMLGNGAALENPALFKVPEIENAIEISAGYSHTCALLSDTSVKCWGHNYNGQIGTGTRNEKIIHSPVTVPGISGVAHISLGGDTSCAILKNGKLMCWGVDFTAPLRSLHNPYDAPPPLNEKPVEIAVNYITKNIAMTFNPANYMIKDIEITFGSACIITGDGSVKCWQPSRDMVPGRDIFSDTPRELTAIPGLNNVTQISMTNAHTCATIAGGTIKCWGDNTRSQLANGEPVFSPPVYAKL